MRPSSQNYRISFRDGSLWIAAPSHLLARRLPMTEEMPGFHLRMLECDIRQTRISASWAQASCRLDPTDKASIKFSNVLPDRKEHIYASAVCPPGARLAGCSRPMISWPISFRDWQVAVWGRFVRDGSRPRTL